MKRMTLLLALVLTLFLCAACGADNAGGVITPRDLTVSNMEVDNYPEAWDGAWLVSLVDFNQAVADQGGNYQPYGSLAWENGTIKLVLFNPMPEQDSEAHGIRIQYASADRDEIVEWNNSDPRFAIYDDGDSMSAGMARWLWNTMAANDTVTSVAEAGLTTGNAASFLADGVWH